MIEFIRNWLAVSTPEVETKIDSHGNLYLTKGSPVEGGYPTLCCHLDQAQERHSPDFTVIEDEGIIRGFSPANARSEGLGADDKNGIWVCLQCLLRCPSLKVFMAVMEEKGLFGSKFADMSFFSDSLYVLGIDAPKGNEVRSILRTIPCANDAFVADLRLEDYGYIHKEGKSTDILALKVNGLQVSCVNISAGYYNPHKDDEYTVVDELFKCLEFTVHTVTNITKPYPHIFKTETQKWIEAKESGKL